MDRSIARKARLTPFFLLTALAGAYACGGDDDPTPEEQPTSSSGTPAGSSGQPATSSGEPGSSSGEVNTSSGEPGSSSGLVDTDASVDDAGTDATVDDDASTDAAPDANMVDPACLGNGVDLSTYDFDINLPASLTPPGGLATADVPQFVAFSWDDNPWSGIGNGVTGGMKWILDYYADHQHATGTPLTSSFYLASRYTINTHGDYVNVKRIHNRAYVEGHEIGMHTRDHGNGGVTGSNYTVAQWETQHDHGIDAITKPFNDAASNLDANGFGVPRGEINGFRAPFVSFNDNLFTSLKNKQIWYDSSIQEGVQFNQVNTNYFWPYTLDSGAPSTKNGPQGASNWYPTATYEVAPIEGLWEMPVYPVVIPPDDRAAEYGFEPGLRTRMHNAQPDWGIAASGKVVGSDSNLWDDIRLNKAEFLAVMKYTLDQRLANSRVPFIFVTHTEYYASNRTPIHNATIAERREAIEEFYAYALTKQAVRISSVRDVLNWMRDPKPVRCL